MRRSPRRRTATISPASRWNCWYVPGARVRHRKSATAGNASKFKAFHVERNRIYNAIKLLPRFILFMSPFFALNRYLLQAYAAATHRGISSEFVEKYSVVRSVWIVLWAHCAAALRVPRMLRMYMLQQWYSMSDEALEVFVDRQMAELGYTSLAELASIKMPVLVMGTETVAGYLPVELEEGWQRMTLNEAIALLDRRQGREG